MNSKTKALVEPDGGSKGIVSAKAAGSAAQNGKNLPGLLSACFSWLAVKSLLFLFDEMMGEFQLISRLFA